MTLRDRLDGPEDADVLVLSNSIGTTLEVWDRVVPAFAGRHRVVRYDHPADANSVPMLADGLPALLDELGLRRVSICGLSIGGAVGMWLAATAPERVERLVLACTSARFGPPSGYRERAALVRAEGMAAVADVSMERWFTTRFADTARYRAMLVSTPAETYAGTCEALAAWDFRDRLGEIAAPTLVIAGAEDPATPPAHAELIAAGIPGAQLLVLEDAAHFAQVERPEAFAEAVLDHLEKVPA
jgi:3-oxoadipate enol-lactonase